MKTCPPTGDIFQLLLSISISPQRGIRRRQHAGSLAFTRLELVVITAALMLLMLVALPMTAGISTRADRVACVNNLRLIGRAYNIWANEHNDTFPWQNAWVPNDPANSGTYGHPFHEQLWFQLFCLSNELKSPAFLSCPGDQRPAIKTATTWDKNPQGGFLNGSYQNNAVSYLLNLHMMFQIPKSIVAMDRNVTTSMRSSCSWHFTTTAGFIQPLGSIGWTNDVHGKVGNIVFMDGQVEQYNSTTLRQAFLLRNPPADNFIAHFLFPF